MHVAVTDAGRTRQNMETCSEKIIVISWSAFICIRSLSHLVHMDSERHFMCLSRNTERHNVEWRKTNNFNRNATVLRRTKGSHSHIQHGKIKLAHPEITSSISSELPTIWTTTKKHHCSASPIDHRNKYIYMLSYHASIPHANTEMQSKE